MELDRNKEADGAEEDGEDDEDDDGEGGDKHQSRSSPARTVAWKRPARTYMGGVARRREAAVEVERASVGALATTAGCSAHHALTAGSSDKRNRAR